MMASTPTDPPKKAGYEALARAQEAMQAAREGAVSPKAPAKNRTAALQAPVKPPLRTAQSATRPKPAVAAKVAPAATGTLASSFDALEQAHRRFNRPGSNEAADRTGNVDEAAAPTPAPPTVQERAPDKRNAPISFDEVSREALVRQVSALLHSMADYYGVTADELAAEKSRVAALDGAKLEVTVSAYQAASQHVMVVTSDAHAREAGLAANAKVAAFYRKHGVTEEDTRVSAKVAKASP